MPRRWTQSLWFKLFVAFALVATLGVGTVALASRQAVARHFTIYVSQGRQQRAEQWAGILSDTLQDLPSEERAAAWQEAESLVESIYTTERGSGQGRGQGRGRQLDPDDRILLIDVDGQIVYDSQSQMTGQDADAALLDRAARIEVDGQVFGYLLLAQTDLSTRSALEEQFLEAINRAVLWAAGLTTLAALVAVALLTRQLVAPLRRLTSAAEAMAAGDLGQRVPERTRDEIGELSRAFNDMAGDLQAADNQRRQMTADIAHELRNPLSVIRGNLEAMLDSLYPTDAEHLAPVLEETLLLQRLVEDLRLLSLAETGQLALTRTEIDVGQLLESVADGVRAVAEDKELALQVRTPPEPLLLQGDSARLRQVLGNLVGNALRYTPPGGEIALAASRHDEQARIIVSDTGPGIAPQDLPHVFDRFYRSDAARARASGGSGLGLAIAQALVRAHNGTLSVESELGQGARFTIDLPRA
jgi:two-component system sensor histidine kinase BaeS